MFSRVATCTPVSMRRSTFVTLDVRDERLDREVAHLHRILEDEAVERAVLQPLDEVV